MQPISGVLGITLRMMSSAYIYGIWVKGDLHPFYVGSTRHSVERRFGNHLYGVTSGTHSNKHFINKVKKHGVDCVEVRTIKAVPVDRQFDVEKDEIERQLACGAELVNKVHVHHAWDRWFDDKLEEPDYLSDEAMTERLLYLKENGFSGKAHDPRLQPLADRMGEIIKLTLRHIRDKFPDEAHPLIFELDLD